MKKLFIPLLATACFTTPAFCETQPSAPLDMTKISYVLGYQIGHSVKNYHIALDSTNFSKGISDGLSGKPSAYTPSESQALIETFQNQMEKKMINDQNTLADTNQAASDAFMQKVAQDPSIVKIENGLYYKALTTGKGSKPSAKDSVKVNYEGSLINGTVFDSSYKRGTPISFRLNQVIPGWTKALQEMPVGSTWIVYIAPDLAYGKYAPPSIGPNQALVFKIELLAINP